MASVQSVIRLVARWFSGSLRRGRMCCLAACCRRASLHCDQSIEAIQRSARAGHRRPDPRRSICCRARRGRRDRHSGSTAERPRAADLSRRRHARPRGPHVVERERRRAATATISISKTRRSRRWPRSSSATSSASATRSTRACRARSRSPRAGRCRKPTSLFVLENALRDEQRRAGARPQRLSADAGRRSGRHRRRRCDTRGGRPKPGYGISVVPLRYVSAQTVFKLLDSFAVKARHGARRYRPQHR